MKKRWSLRVGYYIWQEFEERMRVRFDIFKLNIMNITDCLKDFDKYKKGKIIGSCLTLITRMKSFLIFHNFI